MADQNKKQQTEASRELERLFGSDEEQKMSFIEQQKISLISRTYKISPVFFKMFFDKIYRKDRYNTIVSKIDDYKNINEFRTIVV